MQMGLIQERQDVNKLSVISLFRCVAMSFVWFDTYKSKPKNFTLIWALNTEGYVLWCYVYTYIECWRLHPHISLSDSVCNSFNFSSDDNILSEQWTTSNRKSVTEVFAVFGILKLPHFSALIFNAIDNYKRQ